MRRARAFAALLAVAVAIGIPGARNAQAQPLEAAVKAAFLPKFAPYVSWPTGAAPVPGAPYAICVVGRDPFGALLDEATIGQRLGPSALTVRRIDQIDRASGCQIAFIGGSPRQSVKAALAAVSGAPVLTVTDARSTRERGMVHFELKSGRVRFHIDDAAAARAGLGLSSKLLGLAISVQERGR
jgi:hypothetical protein